MERHELRVAGLAEPTTHYADAVRFGDLLFISGCAPIDRAGQLVGGDDTREQTRQVLFNMEMVLASAGATFSEVLAVTIYLVDIADRSRIDSVRAEFFGDAKPASTLVGVSELAVPGMKVEIEAIAGIRR